MVLAIVVIVVVFLALTYNRLVTLRQRVKEAFSDIDVQLKRRHDLIPNLVETVKGYAAHERGVFDEVTQARAGAIAAGAQGPQQRAAAEDMLTGALRSLFAVAEAYPQLQAVQEYKDLSENLRDTEDKIQFARRFYNGQVRDYNTALQTFPTVVLAGAMGFTSSEYFDWQAQWASRRPNTSKSRRPRTARSRRSASRPPRSTPWTSPASQADQRRRRTSTSTTRSPATAGARG
ncbi:MAG: LemA family protein [Chloroflexi bacterium]|nr:MAG: LemA family protein [Chloroflexota bacterium]